MFTIILDYGHGADTRSSGGNPKAYDFGDHVRYEGRMNREAAAAFIEAWDRVTDRFYKAIEEIKAGGGWPCSPWLDESGAGTIVYRLKQAADTQLYDCVSGAYVRGRDGSRRNWRELWKGDALLVLRANRANRIYREALARQERTLFVSLHHNNIPAWSGKDAKGKGQTRTNRQYLFTYPKASQASTEAAELITREAGKVAPDGCEHLQRDFFVLGRTAGPAVLWEMGFFDNPECRPMTAEELIPIVRALILDAVPGAAEAWEAYTK